jgi:putative membrane protein
MAAAAGLLVGAAIVRHFDVQAVFAAVRPIGIGGFLLVLLAQAALSLPLGLAWWIVALQPTRRLAVFAWTSLVAEAAEALLPFAQIGAAAIASRAAVIVGVEAPVAVASNVVDITLELAAQLIYTLSGAVLLADRLQGDGAAPLNAAVWSGLGLLAALVAGLLVAQKWGLAVLGWMLRRIAPAHPGSRRTTEAIAGLYRRPRRLVACLALHIAAWFASAGATWLILALIGRPLPLWRTAALESLMLAVRNVAFFVPAGLGVQEGAYVVLGPLFGLPPHAALALSLLKRSRDVALGIPVLISWQAMEIRRPLRRRRG